MNFYAHTSDGPWEPLEEHLLLVASYCERNSAKFDCHEIGRLLGNWHDLGKYSQEFQDYLKGVGGADVHVGELTSKVDHSTAGAKFANENKKLHLLVRRAMAYCIAGHHAGLCNAAAEGHCSPLDNRLTKIVAEWETNAPGHLLRINPLGLPTRIESSIKFQLERRNLSKLDTQSRQDAGFAWAMFVRMLFSSLVDADFLATEEFMSPAQAALRPIYRSQFSEMNACLDRKLHELSNSTSGPISDIRREIVDACNTSASHRPGLFSLTVPTGGGKTLSAMSFALKHILAHPEKHFDRVIIAIPFTSIIEQTASVYESVFSSLGEDVVLEHHSNVEAKKETDHSRLAAENFDSPVVVTTNVQLFESLFAHRTSKCRKLHNIARSVIILDEAQTLPVEFLESTLKAIDELVRTYGCTVVLCTATQPAIQRNEEFSIGLEKIHEIIANPSDLYKRMRRVNVEHIGDRNTEELVGVLNPNKQFLCIVNTRPDALELYRGLEQTGSTKGLFHLSTFMCPMHRQATLDSIRRRLTDGRSCRVVSTQLIEAGVDVDFPVVYRSIAGLDSIAQAAGRCNREGKLKIGIVRVFNPPKLPPGYLRSTAESALKLLHKHQNDLIAPEAVLDYFRQHYWNHSASWDKHGIMKMHRDVTKGNVDFSSIGSAYQLIKDEGISVVVPYNKEARTLMKRLRKTNPIDHPLPRSERKQIDRYSVRLFPQHVLPHINRDFELAFGDRYTLLANESLYDPNVGMDVAKMGMVDAGDLVI
ncbi:MAG: CRISPR-associated helicase Cas3' [Pirellula sp.]|nr:CRISPR-associated helicase Cas3' [Pirellula sp.]